MESKELAVKLVCNRLLEEGQITQTEYDSIINKYSSDEDISLTPVYQEDKTNSTDLNNNLIESAIDISTLFKELDTIDIAIKKYDSLNQSILNSIKLDNKKIQDELYEIENKIKAKNMYTYYETFRDTSRITKYNDYKYNSVQVDFDKFIEAIKLKPNNSINTLLSKSGSMMGKVEILDKYAAMFTTYRNNYNSLNSAIDNSMETYWHECIEVDEPIQINYISDVTNITNGAICELLVTMPSLMEINEINLTPFCEFPLEVVEISYSTGEDEEFIPIIFNINHEPNNKYMVNKLSLNTIMYQFESIKVKQIKIVLNQVHYGVNHFVNNSANTLINGIFLKSDNEELIERIMEPLNDAIINETFEIQLDRQVNNVNKLQYEYGLYNIAIKNNEYYSKSEFVSEPYQFPGLSTIVLNTHEEHYEIGINDPIITTSIEYELIIEDGDNSYYYNILPYNNDKVKHELLNPTQDLTNNRVFANTRFEMDLSNIGNNIIIYKDEERVNFGYTFINNTTIEFIEFDPFAKYTITYNLDDIDKAKEIKVPTFTERIELVDIRIRATLKQNSRIYTEVTPILHDYLFYAIDVPVPVGEYNDLEELLIIPGKSYTNVPYAIPVCTCGKPVLLEIEILQDPIIINTNESQNGILEPTDVVEVDEYME